MTETLIDLPGLKLRRLPRDAQWLLQARPADAGALAWATGLTLPTAPLAAEASGDWTALHLSADEWLLLADAAADGTALAQQVAAAGISASLVDVSDRSFAVELTGSLAEDALAGGCPLDVARLPPQYCTRTLLGKVTVLLRRSGSRWRLDYPRSLDGYVIDLLAVIATDAAS